MPKKANQSKLASNYPALVRQVQAELDNLGFFVRRKTIECYWNIGRCIHNHILENEERAEYGALALVKLSQDVGKDISTLKRSLKFYRTYPQIGATRHQLSWSQYRQLITIKDKNQRKDLEEQFIRKEFDTRKSQAFLNFKKIQLAAKSEPDKPITQLAFNRGKLWTYGIADSNKDDGRSFDKLRTASQPSGLLLDLGFRVRKNFPEAEDLRLSKGDCVQVEPEKSNSFIRLRQKTTDVSPWMNGEKDHAKPKAKALWRSRVKASADSAEESRDTTDVTDWVK